MILSCLRTNTSFQLLWLFVAALLFNCSVDCSGLGSGNIYNQQESFIEIVLEQVMGMGNVIAEDDYADFDQDFTLKKSNTVDVFLLPDFSMIEAGLGVLNSLKVKKRTFPFYFSPSLEIQSPPPDVNCD